MGWATVVGEASIGAARPKTVQKLAARILNVTNISGTLGIGLVLYEYIYENAVAGSLTKQTSDDSGCSAITFHLESRQDLDFSLLPRLLWSSSCPPSVAPILGVVFLFMAP